MFQNSHLLKITGSVVFNGNKTGLLWTKTSRVEMVDHARHFFSLTCSVNFLKADHEPSKSNGKSSFFPKIFGKNL